MTIGEGGKYDAECEQLLHEQSAVTTCLIVIGGLRGTGFSLNTRDPHHARFTAAVLRDVAKQLEHDAKQLEQKQPRT